MASEARGPMTHPLDHLWRRAGNTTGRAMFALRPTAMASPVIRSWRDNRPTTLHWVSVVGTDRAALHDPVGTPASLGLTPADQRAVRDDESPWYSDRVPIPAPPAPAFAGA